MNRKWRKIARRFYRASRGRYDSELFPHQLLEELEEDADGDQVYPKLPFAVFVDFMIRALLSTRTKPSLRRLARRSIRPSIQRISGVAQVTHQAIADRLQTVNLDSLQTLFQHVSDAARRLLGRGFRRRGRLKLFDCTTKEASAEAVPWAADNGDKNAVRILVGISGTSDLPHTLTDASTTTSDNSIFAAIVEALHPGDIGVFDAGFTKLARFCDIIHKGAHFVARMTRSYHVEVTHRYQLPQGERVRFEGWQLLEDARVLVGTPRSGGPIEARRVIWIKFNEDGTAVLRAIWTDLFTLTPKRVFEIDRIRWRLEVQFRWLKSELGLAHLVSYNYQGVQAYFLLVMLAWICLRLFDARQRGIPVDQFSCAEALDAWETTLEYYLLGEAVS